MTTKRVYLIANNRNPTETMINYINNLSVNDEDIIVVFNNPVKHFSDKLPKIDYACYRKFVTGFHGVSIIDDKINAISANAKNHIFHDTDENDYYLKKVINVNSLQKEQYELNKNNKVYIYKNYKYEYPIIPGGNEEYKYDKAPTTGFHYIFYFLNKYPDHIITLIGFKLSGDSPWHDFDGEAKVVDDLTERGYVERII